MRRIPFLLAGLFIALTLFRVAWFVSDALKAGAMGYVFSVGLGVAVYASSYWTRTQTTRKAALVSLVLFVLVDGYFNLTEVIRAIDWYAAGPMVQVAAVAYGVFPTCAAALLGWMQSSVNRLPPISRKPGVRDALRLRIIDRLKIDMPAVQDAPQIETDVAQVEQLPAPADTMAEQVKRYMILHGVSRTTAYRHVKRGEQ